MSDWLSVLGDFVVVGTFSFSLLKGLNERVHFALMAAGVAAVTAGNLLAGDASGAIISAAALGLALYRLYGAATKASGKDGAA